MRFDNVNYETQSRNDGPELDSTRRSMGTGTPTPPAAVAGRIIMAIFMGIGFVFVAIGIVLLVTTEEPMPGMFFIPFGAIFAGVGASTGKAIRSGMAQGRSTVQSRINTTPRSQSDSSREAYVYAANPGYGASEHDELRTRVYDQQRRIDSLERRCDALEAELNRLK